MAFKTVYELYLKEQTNATMLLRLFAQFPFAFGVFFVKDDRHFLYCLNTELCFEHLTETLRFVFMNMTTVTV